MTGVGSVVITGASSGIGQACALRLDHLGFRVFAGVRNPAAGESLQRRASERLRPLAIDVTDEASLAAARQIVQDEVGPAGLQGLVNNAGISIGGPLETLPLGALRQQLEVNLVGQLATTQAFLELLRRGRGRIVMMGSAAGRFAFPFVGPYSASKFALEALTGSLRLELARWEIPVVMVEPGSVRTPIWEKGLEHGNTLQNSLPAEARALYAAEVQRARRFAQSKAQRGIAAERVAEAVARALTSPRPRRRYVVGWDARLVELLRLLPSGLTEGLLRRGLQRQ